LIIPVCWLHCVAGPRGENRERKQRAIDAGRLVWISQQQVTPCLNKLSRISTARFAKRRGARQNWIITEQTSWLLFLKYLDGLEQDKATEAALAGKPYSFILDTPYRWESWAAPKGKDGKLDHNTALTGDDPRDFVNGKLFPYLHGFTQRASGPNTIEYKIGQIFAEIKNKILSGYNLRDIIEHIDELRFRSQAEKHELSALYEEKTKRMGNAGRNGGEYYTSGPDR
jgi:type I restriction enzyme M protein